jgi:succinylglutamic semialdehyde dehydrogenase
MPDHYIDGRWHAGAGEWMASTCPATGEQVWEGRAAAAADVERACTAARRAATPWARTALPERAALLRRFKDALGRQAEPLARQIALEVGKPLWEARTEVAAMAAKVDISLQAHAERTGTRDSAAGEGHQLLTHRPHGVLAVLGPYNFPGHLPNGHIVPALVAGNTVVFKPSEYAPGVARLTALCWDEAGLPPGVLNVVNGGRDTGEALVAQPGIDGVLFTGSHATGAALSRQFAGRPDKMLALEMGGNNPLVAWRVGAVEAAAVAIVQSAFISAGQRCTCARRLIVDDGAQGRAVVERVLALARGLRVGAWDAQPEPFMGPVVSARVARALLDAQDALLRLGARALEPMRCLQPGTGLLSPGVLDVTGVAKLPDEELFGPLLQVERVGSFDAAIAAANRTSYGLAAGLLSEDESLWQRFWLEARAGVVNWNKPTTGASSNVPFGGIGRSGNHRPSAYYAADYCAYPVAGSTAPRLALPSQPIPGLALAA